MAGGIAIAFGWNNPWWYCAFHAKNSSLSAKHGRFGFENRDRNSVGCHDLFSIQPSVS
jgi:hypothetical protein